MYNNTIFLQFLFCHHIWFKRQMAREIERKIQRGRQIRDENEERAEGEKEQEGGVGEMTDSAS